MAETCGNLKPGADAYKGHVQFRSDVSGKAGVFSTDAGKSKVTEGRKPPLANKGKGQSSSHGSRGYMHPKVKGSKEKD